MIGVVSSGNPEVDRLAGELCRRGLLSTCVRRYANRERWWERLPYSFFVHGDRFASTIGRRSLPLGLSKERVQDAGVLYDFLAAISLRSARGGIAIRSTRRLWNRRNVAIAKAGARLLGGSRTVLSNYGVAESVFGRVKTFGGQTILNYPNAHHRYSRRLIAEEKELEPSFASTFTEETTRYTTTYDRECELADMIMVGSSFVYRSFVEEGLGAKHIAIISYGSDTSRFYPAENPTTEAGLRAIYVGQLSQRKGLSYLLRGWRMFRGPNTELRVAGTPINGSFAALKPYSSLFTYLGNLSHKDLARAYRQADVFVFPTLLEGMPLVVLEAMASGLPVITTDRGPGDIVRDGVDGFIVPIRDPESIADRLEYLRSNPERRVEMGRAARMRALTFSWERYCQIAADCVASFAAGNQENDIRAVAHVSERNKTLWTGDRSY
jgi:glycosyltransferase involved in cell wall biosynthesis